MNSPPIEERLARFRSFWNRERVARPVLGFDLGGTHLLRQLKPLRQLRVSDRMLPENLNPLECLDGYDEYFRRASAVPGDLVRGVAPLNAVPWIEAMMGCSVFYAGDSIWAEEREADWAALQAFDVSDANPWFAKYKEFLRTLTEHAGGCYPVGQPIFRGITDLMAVLRGHAQSLLDCVDTPELATALARRCAEVLMQVCRAQHEIIEPFHGGSYLDQYGYWAPGLIDRHQEDNSSIYSPRLYRDIIMECDRMLADDAPACLFHLHGSSLFLLEFFLEITSIDVFQISKDPSGMGIEEMIPHLRRIQASERSLILKGKFTPEEMIMIAAALAPDGFFLLSEVASADDADEQFEFLLGLWGRRVQRPVNSDQ